MARVTNREYHEPSADRPPLRVTFGRTDTGNYSATIEVGGLPPVVVASLLTEAAASIANEVGAVNAQTLLSTIGQALWSMAPPEFLPTPTGDCPDCGGSH